MSFNQKNYTTAFVNFTLILGWFCFRVTQMMQNETLTQANVFRLWAIVIALAILGTILAIILVHIISSAILVMRTGDKNAKIEDLEDERDKLIDLKATQVTYSASSLGVFTAMLSFALGYPPLVMFNLLIFFGILAQVIGIATRLILYQRGF